MNHLPKKTWGEHLENICENTTYRNMLFGDYNFMKHEVFPNCRIMEAIGFSMHLKKVGFLRHSLKRLYKSANYFLFQPEFRIHGPVISI